MRYLARIAIVLACMAGFMAPLAAQAVTVNPPDAYPLAVHHRSYVQKARESWGDPHESSRYRANAQQAREASIRHRARKRAKREAS
jgi:hypothetical protein